MFLAIRIGQNNFYMYPTVTILETGMLGKPQYTLCLKNDPILKRYGSKLYGSILMLFGRNIQKTLE